MDTDIEDRLDRLDLAGTVALLTGASFWRLPGAPEIGLHEIVTSDGPVGVRGQRLDEREWSLALPCPTALGATWDPSLANRLGGLLAAEARRQGVHVLLAPGVNLHRSPLAGRAFEYFSEDPLLTARVALGYVRGVQEGGVAATAKHFVAGESETERMTVDNRVDERTLRELYLAPFEALVRDGGVWVVLSAYNGVNGTTMSAHPLLTDPLKTEWGFDGVVVSDWTAVRTTVDTGAGGLDLVMPGPDGPWGAELVQAVQDGEVPVAAVRDKARRLLRLAARLGRLDGTAPAAVPAELQESHFPAISLRECGFPATGHRELLREAAAAGTVLVRNQGDVLPLGGAPRVALLGPHATRPRVQGGGSARVFPRDVVTPLDGLRRALGVEPTHTEGVHLDDRPLPLTAADVVDGLHVTLHHPDGDRHEHRHAGFLVWVEDPLAAATPEIEVTTQLRADVTGEWLLALGGVGHYTLELDGRVAFATELDPAEGPWPPYRTHAVTLDAGDTVELRARYRPRPGRPDAPSVHVAARRPRRSAAAELDRAVALAAAADVAVVVVGTSEEIESEGFDRTSLALPAGQDELVARVAAANPRTVVVLNCGAPVLLPWLDDVAACLLAWFPGQEFGDALADVLTGRVEPGGRLPLTWPRTADDVPSTRPTGGRLDYAEGLAIGHRAGGDPLLPFGHGLGYTTWELADLRADGAAARVRVTNTGARRGRQVVQLYLARPDSTITRPVRWLAGFAAVHADPGEQVDVSIAFDERAFAHWDVTAGGWAVEDGRFELYAGTSAADLPLRTDIAPPTEGAPR